MKFSDIPQFTRPSNYRIDMPWDGMPSFLELYNGRRGVELDPDFQRGHVWTEAQQTAFVEFRLKGGMTGREIYFNQPENRGWASGKLVLVDGLQRWTAVTKFMNNELPIFDGILLSEFEGRQPKLDREWMFSIHINNLEKKSDVLRWYLEMNTGGVIHTDEEIARVQKLLDEENEND